MRTRARTASWTRFIGRRPDGIVLTGIMHSPEDRHRLIASGIPVVETWDYTPTPIDMLVGFSHDRVGEESAAISRARGRKRLAVISGDDDRARRRQKSFEQAAARLGLPIPQVELVPAPATHASGAQGAREPVARAIRRSTRCSAARTRSRWP
jgi:LacI family gluconate utilization system Gnt-I transcriptional repressor